MLRQGIGHAQPHTFDSRRQPIDALAQLLEAQRLLAHRVVDLAPRALCLDQCLAGLPRIATDPPQAVLEFAFELPLQHALEERDLVTNFLCLGNIRAQRL